MSDVVTAVHEAESWEALTTAGPGAYLITTASGTGTLGFIINCPRCGAAASSAAAHTVESRNPLTVAPSFVCPHEGCGAHYFVRGGRIEWV